MRTWILISAIFTLVLSTSANAAVVLNDSQTSTTAGENFNFNFLAQPASDGNGGSLVFRATGDFVHSRSIGGPGYEAFTWNIEGIISGGPLGSFVSSDDVNIDSSEGGTFDFVNYSGGIGFIDFQKTYALDGYTLDSILSDGNINLFVDLGDGVSGAGNGIEVSLTYNQVSNVPLPAAVWLFGSGLIGLASVARRKCRI